MSLVTEFANERLIEVSPGLLTAADVATGLESPADPVMATFLTVTCPEVVALVGAATGALAANVYNYVSRNG
ncbi:MULTISPECIES: linaridin-like RiPP [unclassified Embleya]|uniref:linaridin-like RiPP n=1 Tax=unclassified Embleya TaxID=2699296 RepID=UPI0036B02011